MLVSTDVGDLGPEVRRLFEDLARRRPDRRHVVSGECLPVLDVLETEKTIEIVLDVPGVVADGLRVMIKSGIVLIAGEKERPELNVKGPASFHLVERDFGRFARAIRVNAAFDASQARARLQEGELRVVLPKIQERRGREFLIHVDTGPSEPASPKPPAGEGGPKPQGGEGGPKPQGGKGGA
jgi:HSP20 family protein